MSTYDVAIVGAGIAGLSLAYHLRQKGKSVVVLEKSARAEGATTRNFGMLWVVGQPTPDTQELAAHSQHHWHEAANKYGFWIRQSGSLHLAYEPAELSVLEEYLARNPDDRRKLRSPAEVADLCPLIKSQGLMGGLHSSTEAAVDPREAVHVIADGLLKDGVDIRFETAVERAQSGEVHLADGTTLRADQIVICPGPDFQTFLPREFETSELEECRLQMLRLSPMPETPRLGVHLCAGLTLAHYKNFAKCPSLDKVKRLHEQKWPDQIKHGIHVLVSEHADGVLTVGDSHAYGRKGPIYLEENISDAILCALDEFLPTSGYTITQRWMGTYNTHPTLTHFYRRLDSSTSILNLFGTGMTLSFGLTEQIAAQLL